MTHRHGEFLCEHDHIDGLITAGIFEWDAAANLAFAQGKRLPTWKIDAEYSDGTTYADNPMAFAYLRLESGATAILHMCGPDADPRIYLQVDDLGIDIRERSDGDFEAFPDCLGDICEGCWHTRGVERLIIDSTDIFGALADWSRVPVHGLIAAREKYRHAAQNREESPNQSEDSDD
jgi:hypothetical protein